MFVGTVTRVKADSVVTVLKATNGIFEVPGSGILTLSTFGDRVISERRKRAKDRIIQKASPIKYLGALVENGTSHFSESWGSHKGVTKELEKSFERSKTLNEMQRIALETAINTPDIALIQGPPGTGKQRLSRLYKNAFGNCLKRRSANGRERILNIPLTVRASSFRAFKMKLSTTRLPILYREICPQIEKEEELI